MREHEPEDAAADDVADADDDDAEVDRAGPLAGLWRAGWRPLVWVPRPVWVVSAAEAPRGWRADVAPCGDGSAPATGLASILPHHHAGPVKVR